MPHFCAGHALTRDVEARGGEVICRAFPGHYHGFYGRAHFAIDLIERTVRCPADQMVTLRKAGDVFQAIFPTPTCAPCVQRPRCQKAGTKTGRVVTVDGDESRRQKWREAEKTKEGRARLRQRTAVEHAQSTHGRLQGPQARYRGVAKNDFDAQRTAAVQNLLTWDRRERLAERARVPQAA